MAPRASGCVLEALVTGAARWSGRRGAAAFVGAAALIAALAAAGPAWAACTITTDVGPGGLSDGDTITCTGIDTDGFDAGATNGLTVNVNAGAEVNTSDGAAQDAALDLGAGSFLPTIVNNLGKITSSDSGAPAIRIKQRSLISNSGTIEQTSDAPAIVMIGIGRSIFVASHIVSNKAGGLIDVSASSASDAIVGAGGLESVSNFGEIKGGISLGDGNDSVSLLDGSTMTGDIDLGNGSDTFFLHTGATFNGTADGGSSGLTTDVFRLQGAGTDTISSSKLVGFERLVKLDPGEWTMTGDIGFAANVMIFDGVLSVVGTLTSPTVTVQSFVNVSASATLADTERVVGNVIVGGAGVSGGAGKLAPGASIGTTTVQGNYTQNDDGTLEIEINATPESDLLAVTGDASLDGALDVVMAAGAYSGLSYEVVTVDGTMTGEFATVTLSGPGAVGDPPFEVVYITDASGSVVLNFLILGPPPPEIFDAYVTAALGQTRLFSDTVRWRLGELRRGGGPRPPGRWCWPRPSRCRACGRARRRASRRRCAKGR